MAKTAFTRRPDFPQRDRHFQNAWTWTRYDDDELNTYPLDMSDDLDSGETASSIEVVDRLGMTVDSSTVTSAGVISITISSGGNGSLKAIITTSAARKLPYPMQWREAYSNKSDNYRR